MSFLNNSILGFIKYDQSLSIPINMNNNLYFKLKVLDSLANKIDCLS